MKFDNVKNKLMDRFFRKIDNVVWDLMSGNLGVRTNEGILTVTGEGDDAEINQNIMDFGVEVPAFAQNTPVDSLKIGDLIVGQKNILGWIVEKKEKSFTLLKPDGTRGRWSPPKVKTLGFDAGGAMVVRSLMGTLGGDTEGEENMKSLQGTLLPMLMMGGDQDMDNILPMMLFSQMNGGGDGNNMMQTIMMMKMLGGKDNNIGNFFDR